jgi:UDP-N-acetylmuramate--alanine ligase
VLVTEIYAAREAPPADGFSSRQLVDAIQHAHADVQPVAGINQAVEMLLNNLKRGDVLLVLSAGDADQVSGLLLKSLGRKDRPFAGPSGSRSKGNV